jgi:molecular chaperone DnaK (HSP70)
LCNEFKRDHGVDLHNDPLALQRLKEADENVYNDDNNDDDDNDDTIFRAA